MSTDHQPLVVVFPRGQLAAKDKERMTKAGIVAVEADNPEAVRQLHLSAPFATTKLSGDDIVRAALSALSSQQTEDGFAKITSNGRANVQFVRLLAKAFQEPKA